MFTTLGMCHNPGTQSVTPKIATVSSGLFTMCYIKGFALVGAQGLAPVDFPPSLQPWACEASQVSPVMMTAPGLQSGGCSSRQAVSWQCEWGVNGVSRYGGVWDHFGWSLLPRCWTWQEGSPKVPAGQDWPQRWWCQYLPKAPLFDCESGFLPQCSQLWFLLLPPPPMQSINCCGACSCQQAT